jgi:L-threonylcarbamoyladenylate synthase
MTAPVTRDVQAAAQWIRRGGLVAFPTETVYGLGANALDAAAVARVFEAKERPRFDPLIVHVRDMASAEALVAEFSPMARRLADRFWPGPLTLVLPKRGVVPEIVTAGLENVGLRIPDHPLALELLDSAGVPVAAPSANLFGRTSPTTAMHVAEQLGERIDLILDGGACRVGVESTVLQLGGDAPTVLRLGGVTVEELEATLGPVRIATEAGDETAPQLAPGLLSRHYAPRTPVRLTAALSAALTGARVGALAWRQIGDPGVYGSSEVLSPSGDLREAAANVFAALRHLDAAGMDVIVAELVPESGLGRAINDRLRRAAAR